MQGAGEGELWGSLDLDGVKGLTFEAGSVGPSQMAGR